MQMKNFVGIVMVAATAACATPRGRVYVRVAPPAPRVERRIVAPGSGYVWVPGYYMWNDARYVWAPGHWVLPPRPRAVWVPAHWQHDRHGWFIIEGHWR